MNELERKMVHQLRDLRENHHVIGVKAEFEAEGTRMEEAMRLKEVVSCAGLGLTMKVGGCEALRDMYEARVIGVERVVGPMVESPWALHKFLSAAALAFPNSERDDVRFSANIETVTGVQNLDAMLKLPEIGELDGVVLGRVDMCGSLGLTRAFMSGTLGVPVLSYAPWAVFCYAGIFFTLLAGFTGLTMAPRKNEDETQPGS